MRVRLLKCLAHAVVKHGGRFLFSLAPGGDVIYDIAVEAWGTYSTTDQADSVRPELEALAQASADQIRQFVADAVQEVAAGQSAQIQEALRVYLTQVPSSIRRSLRRPSDPSGKSVPANVAVRGAEDLVSFLPARMPRFKPGDRPLPGVDWELEELAGIGGFGEVWKAHHAFLKSKPPVALKFCLDNSAAAALRNEAGVLDRVMQQGKHGGIVPLLHTYLTADPPCLEYEFVEGGDLTGLIQEMHARGRVKPEVANRLLLRLAEIVAFAHKAEPPIVHGDLKPANVLVRRTPDGKLGLRVIDFGIGGLAAARAAQETRQPTRSRPALLTEAVRGAHTPLYASAEQMRRRPGERADPRDDVHALGVIWFQLISGDLGMMSIPSDWRDQLVERGVGEDLVRLLGACIAPKAEKRPASAVVLVEQINDANVPMLELADVDAAVPAKAEKPRAVTPKTARPEKPRETSPVVQRATPRPKAQAATVRPASSKPSKNRLLLAVAGGAVLLVGVLGRAAAKPSKNRWLVAGAGAAVVLLVIIVLWAGLRPGNRAKQELNVSPKNAGGLSRENVDKLRVGMTLGEVEQILGPGRRAINSYGFSKQGEFWSVDGGNNNRTWEKEIKEGRVQSWEGAFKVLAAFPGNPSSDSKVDVFLIQQKNQQNAEGTAFISKYYAEQIPSDKWEVNKGNFVKLKVGMTLKEVQDIIGVGQPLGGPEPFMNNDWRRAANEDRVYWWYGKDVRPLIYARFSEPPSAAPATKVEALSFQKE